MFSKEVTYGNNAKAWADVEPSLCRHPWHRWVWEVGYTKDDTPYGWVGNRHYGGHTFTLRKAVIRSTHKADDLAILLTKDWSLVGEMVDTGIYDWDVLPLPEWAPGFLK